MRRSCGNREGNRTSGIFRVQRRCGSEDSGFRHRALALPWRGALLEYFAARAETFAQLPIKVLALTAQGQEQVAVAFLDKLYCSLALAKGYDVLDIPGPWLPALRRLR